MALPNVTWPSQPCLCVVFTISLKLLILLQDRRRHSMAIRFWVINATSTPKNMLKTFAFFLGTIFVVLYDVLLINIGISNFDP